MFPMLASILGYQNLAVSAVGSRIISEKCLVCGGEDLKPSSWQPQNFVTSDALASDFTPVLLVCHECSAIQKDLSPSYIAWTKNLYQNYRVRQLSEQTGVSDASPPLTINAREDSILRLVKNIIRPDHTNLLEIGFGNGSLLRRIKNEFPSLVLAGLEVSDGHRNTLERLGINFIHGEIGSLKKTFDIVIVNNVLEHACDPLDFLLACGRCLGLGGRLIIALPNVKCATYDVIIADHVIHTNAQHVAFLAQKSQFATLFLDDQTIPDQTLIALELTMDPRVLDLPFQPKTLENQVIKKD